MSLSPGLFLLSLTFNRKITRYHIDNPEEILRIVGYCGIFYGPTLGPTVSAHALLASSDEAIPVRCSWEVFKKAKDARWAVHYVGEDWDIVDEKFGRNKKS